MIKVGTLCLLVGDHSRAGQCCTVTAGPRPSRSYSHVKGYHRYLPSVYPIVLASGEPPHYGGSWVAAPNQIIPIAPPGFTESTDKRERLTA